jgi:hypothetical protein
MPKLHPLLLALPILALSQFSSPAAEKLPRSLTFNGDAKFKTIVRKAKAGKWHKLPIGDRTMRFAKELHGTPYKGYTLEIHDHVESPSANLHGLDCWTFFEISLGMARMVEGGAYPDDPGALLRQIEHTRYRAGRCNGHYLDRIHYLAEWFDDNDKRKNIDDITRKLGGAQRMHDRRCTEMTTLWKSYRYLRNNPSYLKPMGKIETRVSSLPVYYIPKSKVKAIESKLRNGDVIGIVTKYQGGFCSHVGLVYKDSKGAARLMHASTTYKKVVIDSTVSGYLHKFNKHAGIMVARPL